MSFFKLPNYNQLRPFLFKLNPELAHNLSLFGMRSLNKLCGLEKIFKQVVPSYPQTIMGIAFPNPVGLAAGLDKDGCCIDALGNLGFGFIEVGTVTPKPQPGNVHPRLFRLIKSEALINRLGFNNAGVAALVKRLQNSKFLAKGGILGVNIGKNSSTQLNKAYEDYLYCLEKVYQYASYIVINVSSPNTNGLRSLQETEALEDLLARLKFRQESLIKETKKYVPLVLKIAPDLTREQITSIAIILNKYKIDGLIATNSTIDRDLDLNLDLNQPYVKESGGLSGAPLLKKSNYILSMFRKEMGADFPIIGTGGILSGKDAASKMAAGANLIQIYTGLVYQGPELIFNAAVAFMKG